MLPAESPVYGLRAVALHHHSDPSTVMELRAAGDADGPRHAEGTRVGEQRPLQAELERLGREVRTRHPDGGSEQQKAFVEHLAQRHVPRVLVLRNAVRLGGLRPVAWTGWSSTTCRGRKEIPTLPPVAAEPLSGSLMVALSDRTRPLTSAATRDNRPRSAGVGRPRR